MQYRKYRVSWRDFPDRLCRTFFIQEDLLLDEVYQIIRDMFAMYRHRGSFIANGHRYITLKEKETGKVGAIDAGLREETDIDETWSDSVLMNCYRLPELGSQFLFIYDYMDIWVFDCEALDETMESDKDHPVIVTDGKGAGIFEDEQYTLWCYLDGDISGDMCEDDEENMYCMPQNLRLSRIGDFDQPLDLEEETRSANEMFFDASAKAGVELYLTIEEYHQKGDEDSKAKVLNLLLDMMYSELSIHAGGYWDRRTERFTPKTLDLSNGMSLIILYSLPVGTVNNPTARWDLYDYLRMLYNDGIDGILIDPASGANNLFFTNSTIGQLLDAFMGE